MCLRHGMHATTMIEVHHFFSSSLSSYGLKELNTPHQKSDLEKKFKRKCSIPRSNPFRSLYWPKAKLNQSGRNIRDV